MIGIPVAVGASQIIAYSDDLVEAGLLANYIYTDVARQVSKDSYFRVRVNDQAGQEFPEFYSPGLKAAKKVSKSQVKTAKIKEFPYYVSYLTPWVAVRFENDKAVFYLMFDNVNEDAVKKGFKEPLAWYRAESIKNARPNELRFKATSKEVGLMAYGNSDSGYVRIKDGDDRLLTLREEQLTKKKVW